MQVRIEKIIAGGLGLGRLPDGMVVFVRHVLPGELVDVETTRKHKSYYQAELKRIIEPSVQRIPPGCPVYHECGGCDLQHGTLGIQHLIKESIVRETMDRAGIQYDDSVVRPLVASPLDFHYRQRIRLHIDKNGVVGFRSYKSHRLVAIKQCPLAAKPLNAALSKLVESGICRQLAPLCREVELILSPGDGRVFLLAHTGQKITKSQRRLWQDITGEAEMVDALFVRVSAHKILAFSGDKTSKNTALYQEITDGVQKKPLSLSWGVGCFSQVNFLQNEQLIRLVCEFSGDLQEKRVLDLYCGMGNFSVPLAARGAVVVGIENHRESIRWAKLNCKRAGGANGVFFRSDVAVGLANLMRNNKKYDLVILDPPRRGAADIIEIMIALAPERLIYISCDPATLMRDLKKLTIGAYKLVTIIPVDMFPQTHHIESVALLEKN